MKTIDQDYIENKFIEYAKLNTRSEIESNAVPSTARQVVLLKNLEQELNNLGLKDVSYSDKDAYVVGRIPSNVTEKITPIGFVAHVDTADFNAENIEPQIHHNYDGTDIDLGHGYTLSAKEFPSLKKVIGHTLITTSGDTLLGADDKAGIAGLLGMAKYLNENSDIKHGDLWLAFGPDEEIGKGQLDLMLKDFRLNSLIPWIMAIREILPTKHLMRQVQELKLKERSSIQVKHMG